MNRKKQKVYILVRWEYSDESFPNILSVYATKRAALNKFFKLQNQLVNASNNYSILEKSVQGSDVIGTRKNNKDEVQTVKITDSLQELKLEAD